MDDGSVSEKTSLEMTANRSLLYRTELLPLVHSLPADHRSQHLGP
jgi:hypothetical protein